MMPTTEVKIPWQLHDSVFGDLPDYATHTAGRDVIVPIDKWADFQAWLRDWEYAREEAE